MFCFWQKSSSKKRAQGDEDEDDEDAFEALFRQLEEDLKNDDLSVDDDDDDISEEDLVKLERELEEALKDDELIGALDSVGDAKTEDESEEEAEEEDKIENGEADCIANPDDEDVEEEGEEEEVDDDDEVMPVKLKNWQRKRLAYALKNGRRKTSVSCNLECVMALCHQQLYKLLISSEIDAMLLWPSAFIIIVCHFSI